MIRDVMVREVPWVLRKGLNASASAIGGLVTFALVDDPTVAILTGAAIAMVITGLGHTDRVSLPIFHRDG